MNSLGIKNFIVKSHAIAIKYPQAADLPDTFANAAGGVGARRGRRRRARGLKQGLLPYQELKGRSKAAKGGGRGGQGAQGFEVN